MLFYCVTKRAYRRFDDTLVSNTLFVSRYKIRFQYYLITIQLKFYSLVISIRIHAPASCLYVLRVICFTSSDQATSWHIEVTV